MTVRIATDQVTIYLSGAAVGSEIGRLARIGRAIRDASAAVITVDCAGLTALDRAGVAEFKSWHHDAARNGRLLTFCRVPAGLRDIPAGTGFGAPLVVSDYLTDT